MNCLLCDSESAFFITHSYLTGPFCEVAIDIELYKADIYRCQNCGSVFSKTHRDLSAEKLALLMTRGHEVWEKIKKTVYTNNISYPVGTSPYYQEAAFLHLLVKNGIVKTGDMLDYAAGSGHLSDIVKKYYDITIENYEPFAKDSRQNYISSNELKKYSLVLNCAMFQCLADLSAFSEACNLLETDGALFLQTMVAEEISREYFAHLFFFPMCVNAPTNKGMQILMERSGFVSSIYSPNAKSWVLFKKEPEDIERKIQSINSELYSRQIYYKKGFVDYWK